MKRKGEPPLIKAVEAGIATVAKTLLAAGANPGIRSELYSDLGPLDTAATPWMVQKASMLVMFGADVNFVHAIRLVALQQAAFYTRVDVVKFLLEGGADVHGGTTVMNPLHLTAHVSACDAVLDLLRNGAKVEFTHNRNGPQSLINGCKNLKIRAADLLLTWDADETIKDINGGALKTIIRRGMDKTARGTELRTLNACVGC